MTPHPTRAPSPQWCPAVLADLTCGLPAGHHSAEHYDPVHHTPWLHPDDPTPVPRPLPPTPED